MNRPVPLWLFLVALALLVPGWRWSQVAEGALSVLAAGSAAIGVLILLGLAYVTLPRAQGALIGMRKGWREVATLGLFFGIQAVGLWTLAMAGLADGVTVVLALPVLGYAWALLMAVNRAREDERAGLGMPVKVLPPARHQQPPEF